MITIILPAFNEEPNIGPLLGKLRHELDALQHEYRILVVNDGSTDGTAAVVSNMMAEMNLTLLSNETNLGLGMAIRRGMEEALASALPDDIVITLDADNTHDPSHIAPMLQLMAVGKELVVASRFISGGQEIGLSIYRKLLSRLAKVVFRLIIPVEHVTDFTCGYRAYRASLLQAGLERFGSGLIESTGFSVMTELLLKLSTLNPKCGEVPLVLKYYQKQGKSNLRLFRTIWQYGAVFARFYRSRL